MAGGKKAREKLNSCAEQKDRSLRVGKIEREEESNRKGDKGTFEHRDVQHLVLRCLSAVM